jgi:hypothetical protein
MPALAMNSHVAGLRFFFTTTLDRPDLSRKVLHVSYPASLMSRPAASTITITGTTSAP